MNGMSHMKQRTRHFVPILTLRVVLLSALCLAFIRPAISLAGQVLDGVTGKPLAGAFVIRRWEKVQASPAGAVNTLYAYKTSITDTDGMFQLRSRPIFIGIPVFEQLHEQATVVYKPGYLYEATPNIGNRVELRPTATTAEARQGVCRILHSDFRDPELVGTDANNLRLLQAWDKEEEFIESIRYRIDARQLIENLRKIHHRFDFDTAWRQQIATSQDPAIVAFYENWYSGRYFAQVRTPDAFLFAAWPRTAQGLAPLLSTSRPTGRQRATNDLIFFGPPAVVPLLEALRRNPMWAPSVVPLLARLGSRRAIPIIEDIVYRKPYGKQPVVLGRVFSQLDGKTSPWLSGPMAGFVVDLRLNDDVRQGAAGVLRECGPEGVAALQNALERLPSPAARCRVLAEVGLLDECWTAWLQPYLDDPDIHVRLLAVKALGRCAGDGAIPILADRLHDPHAAIRMRAAEALGVHGRAAALDALTQALSDASPRVRAKAIWALTKLEGADGWRDRIIALLEDDSPMVRLSAAAVLGKDDRLAAMFSGEVEAEAAVAKRGSRLFNEITDARLENVRAQKHPDEPDRHCTVLSTVPAGGSMTMTQWAAMKKARQQRRGTDRPDGCRSLEAVLRDLHAREPQARAEAAIFLGNCPSPEVASALGRVVSEDPSCGVRLSALGALGKMAAADAAPYVLAAVQDREADIRSAAADLVATLPYMGGERGRRTMVAALNDPSPLVRHAAARTLIKHDDAAGLPVLVEHLDNFKGSHELPRFGKLQCLETLPAVHRWIAAAADDPAKARRRQVFTYLVDMLVDLDDPLSFDDLTALLRIFPTHYGRPILNGIGQLADARAEAFLLHILDMDGEWSRYAAEALGYRKSGIAAQRLVDRYLKEDVTDEPLKSYYKTAFIRTGQKAIEPLSGLLRHPEAKRRLVAVYFLGAMGATGVMVQALEDREASVRLGCVTRLAREAIPSSTPYFISMLSDPDQEIREEACRGLLNTGISAAEGLAEQLDSPDTYLRWRAAQLLGEIAPMESESLLVRSLKDAAPEVRWHAVASLVEGQLPAADRALREMTEDKDEGLQACARFVLGQRQALKP